MRNIGELKRPKKAKTLKYEVRKPAPKDACCLGCADGHGCEST